MSMAILIILRVRVMDMILEFMIGGDIHIRYPTTFPF